MGKDYASGRGSTRRKTAARKPAKRKAATRKPATNKRKPASSGGDFGRALKWYGSGVVSGVFACLVGYLVMLPGESEPETVAETPEPAAESAPPVEFSFYTLLPEQTIDVEVDPAEVTAPRTGSAASPEVYILQEGSFRQREDADRRRAELLLLGLQPSVEESNGDNGRWFRVYLGPFDSRSSMSKARSLTASGDIDTLLLKRNRG